MPFCQKCGLFFAKGKECSCVTGGDPAEAAKSERAVSRAAPAAAPVVEPPARLPKTKRNAAPAPVTAPAASRPPPAQSSYSDRGEVVSERTSTSSKYCSGCSEPKTLCKCQPDEGVPFYGRDRAEPAAPVNASAFCSGCLEPRGLCTCARSAAAPAAPAAPEPTRSGPSAREESDRQYAEPARGGRGGAEVSSEGLVMGGSNFCASCGE